LGDADPGDERPWTARRRATVGEEFDDVTSVDLELLSSADGNR
jgi:hypothetical protein